jgi:hypothetical protein
MLLAMEDLSLIGGALSRPGLHGFPPLSEMIKGPYAGSAKNYAVQLATGSRRAAGGTGPGVFPQKRATQLRQASPRKRPLFDDPHRVPGVS